MLEFVATAEFVYDIVYEFESFDNQIVEEDFRR